MSLEAMSLRERLGGMAHNIPNVSVCMAAYNNAAYIQEQVESILEQLREEDELVVVDDASSDQTPEKIASFHDPRIRMFIHPKNRGVVETFEEAVSRATGNILFLCDGDDIWAPNKVQRVLRAFSDHPQAKIVATAVKTIDENGRLLEDYPHKRMRFSSALLPNILRNRFQGSTMAFRASLRDLVLPFPKHKVFLHDAWIGACNSLGGGHVVYIDEPLLYYRRHGSNFSQRLELRQQIVARLQLLLALSGRQMRSKRSFSL